METLGTPATLTEAAEHCVIRINALRSPTAQLAGPTEQAIIASTIRDFLANRLSTFMIEAEGDELALVERICRTLGLIQNGGVNHPTNQGGETP